MNGLPCWQFLSDGWIAFQIRSGWWHLLPAIAKIGFLFQSNGLIVPKGFDGKILIKWTKFWSLETVCPVPGPAAYSILLGAPRLMPPHHCFGHTSKEESKEGSILFSWGLDTQERILEHLGSCSYVHDFEFLLFRCVVAHKNEKKVSLGAPLEASENDSRSYNA